MMPEGYDRLLHWTVILLGIFGVVMQVSANMDSTKVTMAKLFRTTIRQLIIFVASYVGMVWTANYFSFDMVKKYFNEIVVGMGLMLIATMFFGSIGGSRGWIRVPFVGFTLQPSELAKLVMIILVAYYLGDVRRKRGDWMQVMKKPFTIFMAYFFIILVLQRDFGSAMVLMLITAICCLIPTNEILKPGQKLIMILLVVFVLLMMFLLSDAGMVVLDKLPALKYQVVRFKAANNPFTNRYGTGYYDLVNSLIAFNTGGWKGVGLGKSLRKYGYISAAESDFIMAVVVEELGIFGFLFVLIGYGIIVYSFFKYALRVENEKGKIIIVGSAMYYMIHFFFNLGGVTCLIPLTGIPLLLISSGGTSSLAAMACVGMVQSFIVKQNRKIHFKGN